MFSLELNEIGCTDVAEHVIELLDTEPFQGAIPPYSPTTGGGSMGTSTGDARWGRDPPVPIPMVQCSGFGT